MYNDGGGCNVCINLHVFVVSTVSSGVSVSQLCYHRVSRGQRTSLFVFPASR